MSRPRKWPVPGDASQILNMAFKVHNHGRKNYHAELQVEFPQPDGKTTQYITMCHSGSTKCGALRGLIQDMEMANWFHALRKANIRFKVSGEGIDKLYRGYL